MASEITNHIPVNLAQQFPIPSQTSDSDKYFLLCAQEMIRDFSDNYYYLEIGSFLGGSLAPFLRDSSCLEIISVDERERSQPDERGVFFDYAGITTQTMLDNLRANGFDIEKLDAYDASIDALEKPKNPFNLAFIDGEHTDEAMFRDFLWAHAFMNPNSMIMFHDSTIVYKALKLVNIYLKNLGRDFYFFKKEKSEMSAIVFGELINMDIEKYFGIKEDPDKFYAAAETSVLQSNIQNRLQVNIDPKGSVNLRINPQKVVKAY